MKMYECTKTFEIKPPAYSGCGSMLVHKGTLWYGKQPGSDDAGLVNVHINMHICISKRVKSKKYFKNE